MNIEIVYISIYSYFFGSIPFGLILTKFFLKKDLREIGSGNIGATNAFRTGKKFLGVLTLLFDGLKGYISVVITLNYSPEYIYFSSLLCFLGHIFPVWLKFKGGKGVATFIGILLALSWPAGILICLTWLSTAFISRISSLSALISSATSIFWIWFLDKPDAVFVITILTIFIWLRHKNNILRIIAGKETKINK